MHPPLVEVSKESAPPAIAPSLAPSPGTPATRARAEYENALARVALATVVDATPHLGRPPSAGFVAAVLTGREELPFADRGGSGLATFGALVRLSRTEVVHVLAGLVARGWLEPLRARPAGLVLTVLGRAVLDGTATGPPPGAVTPERLEEAERSGVLDALRRFRRDRARAERIPEARVLAETVLREVACARPRDVQELLALTRIGPKRAARYGGELVAIAREPR